MEINSTGNSNLINRPPATISGDTKSKSGNVEAGFIPKEFGETQTKGTLIPPPTPTEETVPEENTVQINDNKGFQQFSINV